MTINRKVQALRRTSVFLSLMVTLLASRPEGNANTYQRYRVRSKPNPHCTPGVEGCSPTCDWGCADCNPGCRSGGWNTGTDPCPTVEDVTVDTYDCATDAVVALGGTNGVPCSPDLCPCDPSYAAQRVDDDSIVPGTDQCGSGSGSGEPQPELCQGTSGIFATVPVDKGCGDENSCSRDDRDPAPVRFSTGHVESNPYTLFSIPGNGDIFFGYRIKYASAQVHVAASARVFNGTQDMIPTIHSSEEVVHFVGRGWDDNFSDRLIITDPNLPTSNRTWIGQNGTVTFINTGGSWKSWSGKYELIDRGANPDRWVVRTTDSTQAKQMWAFDEFSYNNYNGASYTLGRLTRHALLGADLNNLSGIYGFVVGWNTDGTIQAVTDSLGRILTFSYAADTHCDQYDANNQCISLRTLHRSVSGVFFQASSLGPASQVVIVQTDADKRRLERVMRSGAAGYLRFLYWDEPTGQPCVHCSSLLTDVITAGDQATSTPAMFASLQSYEYALEHDGYAPGANSMMSAVYSSSPGRTYGYQYGSVTTQFDLNQRCQTCQVGGPCPVGYALYSDNYCYVADTMQHDPATLLPTSRTSAGGSGPSGNANAFTRGYSSVGIPLTSTDAAGVKTTTGYDTTDRIRCIVHNDDDDQAFADPANPDTSACAGPSTSQIVRVDYNGSCSDGYTRCVVKTTASLLSGSQIEETDLDPTSLRPVRTKTTGSTHDINGTLIQQSPSVTRTFDAIGRLVAENGPLDDSTALDKVSTSYYTSYDASNPFNLGNVYQVTRYVGTATSNTALTTTYGQYDAFGVPHQVTGPNGDSMLYCDGTYSSGLCTQVPGRETWTIVQIGSDQSVIGKSTVVLNPNGTVHTITDADNICLTYEYFGSSTYVSAPTRIRRASSADCGAAITTASSGEVEIRQYANDEADRLSSVSRYTNGALELTYSGFTYDRDRRVISAMGLDSATPFTVNYTDVLATGLTSPGAPAAGTSRTDSTVDAFARPASLSRFIDATNKQTFTFGYATTSTPRPTQLTRGYNGSATSISNFVYDDFGRLVEATVPEAGLPGSPAPTRYEYDVAGRMVKKRVGVGTALVRTSVSTYDSLGRALTVDNDIEHPVNCGSAPAGTPIEDEEYEYDTCPSPDVPSGFACTHGLGRLTMARAIMQCGTASDYVKRGRWYDYDNVGHLARVGYATVSAGTIGPPAIMDYTYSAAGRMTQYRSPINSVFGTEYFFGANDGRVYRATTSTATGATVAQNISYRAFGPLTALTTASVLTTVVARGVFTYRTLRLSNSYRADNSLNESSWSFVWTGGQSASPIAIVDQTFGRTPAGLISSRTDAADSVASRYYGYDALLRMTCEARGDANGSPSAADCTTSSSRVAALLTYGNGQASTSPQDVRATSFIRADASTYVSPSLETSSYSSGSSQVQSVSRSGSTLTISHDVLGRRSYEYDSFDPVRSRRDYTYLPNGQLGSISGQTSSSVAYTASIRYDERGRPVTLTYGGASPDSYELFWDDADRLIAVQIWFPSCRGGSGPPLCWGTWSSARWHYHYVGDRVVAATRELTGKDSNGNPTTAVKRFWAATDDRGLVYRLTDESGATYWQARWDASGWLTWIGTPQTEMWVPFGLPGQIVLGAIEASGSSLHWGTEAYASGTGGTWTRPNVALNRWRWYEPLLGAFGQWDQSDLLARRNPEGYQYGRSNPVAYSDPSGSESGFITFNDKRNDCSTEEQLYTLAAANIAMMYLWTCDKGECGFTANNTFGRYAANIITHLKFNCPKAEENNALSYDGFIVDRDTGLIIEPQEGLLQALTKFHPYPTSLGPIHTELPPGAFNPPPGVPSPCLEQVIAHEALHPTNEDFQSASAWDWAFHTGGYNGGGEEHAVKATAADCVPCKSGSRPGAPKVKKQ